MNHRIIRNISRPDAEIIQTLNRQGKGSPGSVNIEVVYAGAIVRPGDVIVGDQDGVVVVRREAAADVVRLSAERLAKEQISRERYRTGELKVNFDGEREKLARLGVEDVDK